MHMYCSNCGAKISSEDTFCPRCHTSIAVESNNNLNDADNKISSRSRKFAIASFLLAMLPVAIILFSLMCSTDINGEAGNFVTLYFMTIGIPVSGAALITGIMSLMTKKNALAIISIIVSVLPLFFLLSMIII